MTEDNTPELPPLISGKQLELLRQAVEVDQIDARTVGMVGYTARLWTQACLPLSDPRRKNPGLEFWERRNELHNLSLTIRPGLVRKRTGEQYTAFPYGVYPRLLLMWLATEAVRLDERELLLGRSMRSFMGDLGVDQGGGRVHTFNEQVQRLVTAQIIVADLSANARKTDRRLSLESFGFADTVHLLWATKDTGTESMFPASITLSERFYQAIKAAPIPVDLRAVNLMRAAGGGGLSIDLYLWLTYRMFTLRESTLVPWSFLQQQLGADFGRTRDFKVALLAALPKTKLGYPKAKIQVTADGLLLSPSPTPIPRRGSIW